MSESAFSMYAKKRKKSKKKNLSYGEIEELIKNVQEEMPLPSTSKSPKKDKKKKRKVSFESMNGSDTNLAEFPDTNQIVKSGKPKTGIQNLLSTTTNTESSTGAKAHKLLEWLLSPVTPADFFSTYWETQPVHIIRHQSDYYTQILSSSGIDTMLREHPLYFGKNVDVVIYNDGMRETVSPDGRARPSIVWDGYSKGCSVRILNPQSYNDTLHFILAILQEYFGTMVGANVYLTPAGSQGFAPHYDDIEAFIVQLEGKKHWKLYKPLNDSDNLARVSSKDFTRDQLGDLIFEGDVNAGDILYFPRGTVHEAKTDEDQHSLHITISTYQRTSYADLLEHIVPQALQDAAANDIEFRKGLPINYLKHVGITNLGKQSPERIEILKTIQKLFVKMVNYADVDECADKLGRKFMHDALPPVLEVAEQHCSSVRDGDQLENGKVIKRASLTLDTEIRLCRFYACHLVKENDGAVLYFSTQNAKVYHDEEEQYINMDFEMGPIIEILQLQYPDFVKVATMPVEDKAKVLDFVMQLWDYGIVTTKQPIS